MTITEFLAKYPLTITATSIPSRSGASHDLKWEADHWRLTIACPGTARKAFSCEYSTGIGHRVFSAALALRHGVSSDARALGYRDGKRYNGPMDRSLKGREVHALCMAIVAPSLETVLESLSLDASCADQTFHDWCADMGYDTDSRKALDTYMVCQQIATDLRALLGYAGMTDLQSVEW